MLLLYLVILLFEFLLTFTYYVVVLNEFMIVDKICRMKEYFTLILHHGGVLERDNNRRLKYIGGETCVWDKIESDDINMFEIESLVKHCKGYHIIAKLSYMKPYKGVTSDLNICLYPLTTDNHVMDMVKVARANGNEVEIFVEHTVEEREELERDIQEATTQKRIKKPELERSTEIDLLSAEERAVIDKFLANILDTHLNFGATEEHIETTATQITEDVADQATQTTQDTQIGESRKGKEKVTQAPKRNRSLRRNNRIGITINEESPMNFDSSNEDSDLEEDFEIQYKAGQNETMFEVGDSSHENIPRSANIAVDGDENNDTYHSEELRNRISNPQFNESVGFGHVDLKLGMEFSTIQMFKSAVKDFTIHQGSDIKWERSAKLRASAICNKEECDWKIYCSWNEKKKCFQVKTYVPNHTCSKLSTCRKPSAKRKRDTGRPKKRRRKDGDEEPVNGHNMKKSNNEPQCLKCGLLGHNTSRCTKQSVARRLRNWVPPKLQQPQGEYHVAQLDKVVVEEGQMNEEYEEQQVGKNMVVPEEMVQEQVLRLLHFLLTILLSVTLESIMQYLFIYCSL